MPHEEGEFDRVCGECERNVYWNCPDPCLGMLPGVSFACCGHDNQYIPGESTCYIASVTLEGWEEAKENFLATLQHVLRPGIYQAHEYNPNAYNVRALHVNTLGTPEHQRAAAFRVEWSETETGSETISISLFEVTPGHRQILQAGTSHTILDPSGAPLAQLEAVSRSNTTTPAPS